MRSKPSCQWCRNSKVKCSQYDGDKPCRLCVRAGRRRDECILEELPPRARHHNRHASRTNVRSPASYTRPAGSSPLPTTSARQQTPRETAAYSYRREPLFVDMPEHIVDEVVEIFSRNFPEMNFIHIPDFLYQLRTSDTRITVVKLAAIFALCARIHPSFPNRDDQKHGAGQAYAEFVELNMWPQNARRPSLDAVHCHLLIAQYEWGEGNGFSAWMHAGIATRMLQGLHAGSRLLPSAYEQGSEGTLSAEHVWKREIRRRTIWACFVMERTLSCGNDCPPSLDTTAMRTYLPATEDDFDLGLITSERLTYDQLVNQSVASSGRKFTMGDCYTVMIRSLDIFSRSCAWVARGGRRQASVLDKCPWEPESPWHQMKTELFQWRDMQHERLKYPQTPVGLYVHRRQAEWFAFLNLVYYLSVVILYRDYVPFVPACGPELQGPIDAPLLPREAPPDWWSDYTAVLFDAATQIARIVADAKAANMNLQTPIVGYSVFTAASMHVYLATFPWVDARSSKSLDAEDLLRQDLQYLQQFAQVWALGKSWLQVAQKTQELYRQVVSAGSYSQHKEDVLLLRTQIEQYGALSVSQDGNEYDSPGIEKEVVQAPTPTTTNPQTGPTSIPSHASPGLVMPSHNQLDQSIMGGEAERALQDHQMDNFINDWSLWGQDSLMGQPVDDYINLLDFPQRLG
ncbi:hypothetical protein MAPG_05872 [Magnaporthiopsis poae ATCC 64411]|uniref:Zn(2)-C6 fungal-type domain-containing protein n=1 Tax=Magnaporthiopsis poae (strain ATCC 64411 / 73-15) TaxID=644358 RepID=A0A0C4E0J5_MAGP6|nr:hypothetical protein MAPG_05872 [Magnaporthiopsis poae ATCC 64411]